MRTFPALPVPNFVLFPGCTVSLQFGFPALQEQLQVAYQNDGLIVVAHSLQTPEGWNSSEIGCLAEVREVRHTTHGLQAQLAGIDRAKILNHEMRHGRLYWNCQPLPSLEWKRKKWPELSGLPDKVKAFREKMPAELWLDVAAFHMPGLPLQDKLELLGEQDPGRRYYHLLESTRKKKKAHRISFN